ncbi:hypothetical protein Cch02nite_38980 [Catellatospora chokoriensis]|uniref:Uncharacterized protein n=1 Tax=Catellatospora chokoriensis TaxID=310353 RepID=A0A8J3K6N9_9ACTN|nr:hypothetical protein Cch02nite_38980 [Catellatospora chokoriensis]
MYGVYASCDSTNAWVFLHTGAAPVGWRKIEARSADGCSNVLQVAAAAFVNGKDFVLCLLSEANEIRAISKN